MRQTRCCCFHACTGQAEPVTIASIQDFNDTFSQHGFDISTMKPGFGMAESTVYVTDGGDTCLHVDKVALQSENRIDVCDMTAFDQRFEQLDSLSYIISCGNVSKNSDVHLRIVDPESCQVLEEQRVGELWIRRSWQTLYCDHILTRCVCLQSLRSNWLLEHA